MATIFCVLSKCHKIHLDLYHSNKVFSKICENIRGLGIEHRLCFRITLQYVPRKRDESSSSIYAPIWQRTLVAQLIQKTVRILCPGDNLQNGATLTQETLQCLNVEVCYFCFFPYKKYSRRFITLRLNHWWQMEYSGDAFHTFLGLNSVIYLAVNGTVTSLPVLIQNILN